VLQIVQPVYPPDALRHRVRGLVVLKALISEKGVPLQTEVVQGAPGGLTEAALAAVAQWRFEPALVGGSPVRTYTTIRIPFEGVQFATPTPREEPGTSRESAAADAPATPTPTHSPAPPGPAAPGAPARAGFDASPSPVPPEPPSGERGPDGPVFRTRRGVRIALTPAQARVWIDGSFVGIAGDWDRRRGGAELVLDRPGPHALHAELPGHRPFEAEIDVAETADSESAAVTGLLSRFALTPYARLARPAAATRGPIALAVDRPDAELSVDGVAAGLASAFGDDEPLRLSGPAVHELRITSPGGAIRTLRVVVSAAAPAEVPTLRVRIAGAAVPGREPLAGRRRE
jgi:TonB family protein